MHNSNHVEFCIICLHKSVHNLCITCFYLFHELLHASDQSKATWNPGPDLVTCHHQARQQHVLCTKRLDRHLASHSPPLICPSRLWTSRKLWLVSTWCSGSDSTRSLNLSLLVDQELKSYVLEFWKLNHAQIFNMVCSLCWLLDHSIGKHFNDLKTNRAFINQL